MSLLCRCLTRWSGVRRNNSSSRAERVNNLTFASSVPLTGFSLTGHSLQSRGSKFISVILTEDQLKGLRGEKVEVKRGYMRNFLFPRGLALYDIPINQNKFEPPSPEKVLQRKQEKEKEMAKKKLRGIVVKFKRQLLPNGQPHAPVSRANVVEKLLKQHLIQVGEKDVELDTPITTYGVHTVQVTIGNIQVPLKLNIKKR